MLKYRISPMTNRSSRWAVALVSVLLLLNIGVLWALWTDSGPAAAPPPPTGGSLPSSNVPIPSASVSAGDTATAETPEISMASRHLVVVDEQTAWRASLASCTQGESQVERTTSGGETWSPLKTGVDSIVRLRATDARSAFVVGAGAGCETALAVTSDSGATWARADASLSTAWYLAPTDRSVVVGPAGQQPVPCPSGAIDLAATSTSTGAVLCVDGSLAISDDGGSSWRTTTAVPGARALTQNSDGYLVTTYEGECSEWSLYAITVDGQLGDQAWSCAPGSLSGQVALAVLGTDVWLWAGEGLAVSNDQGATW